MKTPNKEKENTKPDKAQVFNTPSNPVDIIKKSEEVTKRWITKDIKPPEGTPKTEEEKKLFRSFAF